MALIEAAAAGLPVVATPVGGVPELVVHERTGFLGATVEELAFGLGQVLERPEERRAMAKAREQEMTAEVASNRARVVLAEAEVPLAMAAAFREGNLESGSGKNG